MVAFAGGIGWAGLVGTYFAVNDFFGAGGLSGANQLLPVWTTVWSLFSIVIGAVDLLDCGGGKSCCGNFGWDWLRSTSLLRSGGLLLHLADVPPGAALRPPFCEPSMLSGYTVRLP